MTDIEVDTCGSQFRDAKSFMIISHIRPDGDAVGSVIALSEALRNNGKKVQMVIADAIPGSLLFLKKAKEIVTKPENTCELKIVLDCSDIKRTGGVIDDGESPDINIDHHLTNIKYGKVNLVRPEAVATCAILGHCFPIWGFEITPVIAEALLTGIIWDSIGFRTTNTTPKDLRLAATLMEQGADLASLYQKSLLRQSYKAVRYWGSALVQLNKEDGIVWTNLTLENRHISGYSGKDDADLVNFLLTIEKIKVAIVFIEQDNNHTKVSWRSKPGIDISSIAVSFGGGGHPEASGADISGNLDDVRKLVLQSTHEFLNKLTNKN